MKYTRAELDFNAKIAAVIMCSMSIDTLTALELHYKELLKKEPRLQFSINKCSNARKSSQAVMEIVSSQLSSLVGGNKEKVQSVIDSVAATVYDIVDLTEQQRTRVNGLIKKLKKEEICQDGKQ